MAKHVGAENLPNAVKSALPRFVAPQLATLVKEPPTGDEWLHELKFDGYRLQAIRSGRYFESRCFATTPSSPYLFTAGAVISG